MVSARKVKKILQGAGSRGGLLGKLAKFFAQLEYLFLFIGLFACLTLLLWNISTLISKGYREKQKFAQVQEDLAAQEEENARLRAELEYQRSDEAAEGGARDVLGMAYDGEEVIFVDESALSGYGSDDSDADLAQTSELADGHWRAWVDLLVYSE